MIVGGLNIKSNLLSYPFGKCLLIILEKMLIVINYNLNFMDKSVKNSCK